MKNKFLGTFYIVATISIVAVLLFTYPKKMDRVEALNQAALDQIKLITDEKIDLQTKITVLERISISAKEVMVDVDTDQLQMHCAPYKMVSKTDAILRLAKLMRGNSEMNDEPARRALKDSLIELERYLSDCAQKNQRS